MADDIVYLSISSNLSSHNYNSKFPLSTTVHQLKGKLELITGANSLTMKLELMDSTTNTLMHTLDDDNKTLRDYNVQSNMGIHVINTDSSRYKGQFDDLSQVEKYEMSDEDYMKRGESLRAFKEKMKLGRFADSPSAGGGDKWREEEMASCISVGSRCEVNLGKGQLLKRGVVMYVGLTEFKDGYWVGVRYDEPVGKNDGSVNGKRYFVCPLKYGAFVKPSCVSVGDYPELSLSDDEM